MYFESALDYREEDKLFWEEELADWMPSRIYDVHAHLFDPSTVDPTSKYLKTIPPASYQDLIDWNATLFPGRDVHFLMLGRPAEGTDVAAHNDYMYEQVTPDPLSRMNRLTIPSTPLEEIEHDVKERGFVGLKVYRLYSVTGDVDNCRIHEFLPHEQMELASELGLWVTMHLSRAEGGGDPQNLDDLEEYTMKRYPGIKWILAHCARSFTYRHAQRAVERLRDMPNIWYDMSAVTDLRPFLSLFQKEDHKRLMFGSDAIDSTSFHGYYIPFGHAWQQLNTDTVPALTFDQTKHKPIVCIYEQLISMKHAAEIAGLTKSQIEDIFWRNAVRELKVDWPE